MSQYYLYHHGIKGQRWGIRRYQNEDGSYTADGKRRYLADKTANIQDKQKKEQVTKKLSRKWDINVAKQNIENKSGYFQKNFFSSATRKRAAKYVVDNNMSYDDAVKKAQNKAVVRNTSIFIGAAGAIAVGTAAAIYRVATDETVLGMIGSAR